MKIHGRESANSDFPFAKLENVKKNSPKTFLVTIKKTRTYIDKHVKTYLNAKFGDFSLKNEFRNVKTGGLIKWSIMHIFNEAEAPWSNSAEILG